MLDQKLVEKAEELLASGISIRKVAKQLGISRGSIGAIKNGTRRIYPTPEPLVAEPGGSYVRCPVCGAKTRLPCVTCAVRALALIPAWAEACGPIEIELSGRHYERYLEVREWREKSPNPHYTDIPEDWPWREKLKTVNK